MIAVIESCRDTVGCNTAQAEMRNIKKTFTEYINQTTRCSNDNLKKKIITEEVLSDTC